MINAQVHRFGDAIALYIGTGETVYLSVKDARKLSGAINRTARSVERETFIKSTCGTFHLEAECARGKEFERKR